MPRLRALTVATSVLALAVTAPAMATAPPNDDFDKPAIVPAVAKPAPVKYTTMSGSTESWEPYEELGDPTVWFRWTPQQPGAAFVTVPCAHQLHVYRVTPGGPVTVTNLERADALDNEFLPQRTSCRFHWRPSKNTPYYVQVINSGPDHNGTLVVSQDTSAPAAPVLQPWAGVTGPEVTATFTGEPDARFICGLHELALKECTSPHALSFTHDGEPTFIVRMIDAHGNIGDAAASHTWRVDATAPQTTIDASSLAFSSSEPATFECRLDGAAFAPCGSPFQHGALAPGKHHLQVRATDPYGNVDETPAYAGFTVAEERKEIVPPPPPPPPPPPACTLKLSAPKTAGRAVLRKGLRVTVSAPAGACTTTVKLRQRGRTLAGRRIQLAPGARVKLSLKARSARRGRAIVVAGSLKRKLKVV